MKLEDAFETYEDFDDVYFNNFSISFEKLLELCGIQNG